MISKAATRENGSSSVGDLDGGIDPEKNRCESSRRLHHKRPAGVGDRLFDLSIHSSMHMGDVYGSRPTRLRGATFHFTAQRRERTQDSPQSLHHQLEGLREARVPHPAHQRLQQVTQDPLITRGPARPGIGVDVIENGRIGVLELVSVRFANSSSPRHR